MRFILLIILLSGCECDIKNKFTCVKYKVEKRRTCGRYGCSELPTFQCDEWELSEVGKKCVGAK